MLQLQPWLPSMPSSVLVLHWSPRGWPTQEIIQIHILHISIHRVLILLLMIRITKNKLSFVWLWFGNYFFLTWEKSNCIIKLIYNGHFKVILTKYSKYNILGFLKSTNQTLGKNQTLNVKIILISGKHYTDSFVLSSLHQEEWWYRRNI